MKLFKNRKRLDNKGFTLIELLAVVVILAIVMGISATSVLNSINNSRKSTLYSAAQNAANNINTWATEDALEQTNNKRKLGDEFENTVRAKSMVWVCLSGLKIQNKDGNASPTTSLLTALGISDADVLVTGNVPSLSSGTYTITSGTSGTCSAIRYNINSGGYEILLVAKTGGKYYVTGDGTAKNYAFSRATATATSITD